MNIGILSGGPAGPSFTLLLKNFDPSHWITVTEQNPAGATYGWGVVFSEREPAFLKENDAEF